MLKRIYIEITNRCNLSCAFCAKHDRPFRHMSTDEFRRVLQEAHEFTDYVYLHVQGEPLLHPQFEDILSICDEENVQVQLVTNGSLLSRYPDLAQHPSLRKVSFSLQSIEYQQADPLEYLDEILRFAKKAGTQGRPYTEIRFWRNDLPEGSKGRICLDELKKRYAFEESSRRKNYRIMDCVWVDFDNEFEWPETSGEDLGNFGHCHGASDQIAILSDGTVTACCLDRNGVIRFGNVYETPLHEILQSGRYRNMTDGFRRGVLTEELCRKCTFRRRFD